jgi:toxin secretion/phage lysis holin
MNIKSTMHAFHHYVIPAKMKLPLLLAAIWLPILGIIEKYLFSDWDFLVFLFIVIALDTVTGVWKHFKKGTVSSQGFGGVIIKTIIYGMFLILVHALVSFPNKPAAAQDIADLLELFGYSGMIFREGLSVIENIEEIRPKTFPSWLIKRLKNFDENGDAN